MSKYTEVDLWFSDIGDLDIDSSGDLRDTKPTYGRAVIQEIRDRLKADQGDWKLAPSIGANLASFLGDAATAEHINRIVRRVEDALTFDRLLQAGEFEVVPIQVGTSIALFRIIISTSEGELDVTIGYDSDTQRFIGY
jgi:hypothetical protein